ncbi:MAG TPA: type II toxin-antitoxin system RelE/ParE family toxin [Thermoplasmata archaeon]|nr:type II toxin-antitoxin system RelE/ParE family toxin [Thermoplasmata archaeon]
MPWSIQWTDQAVRDLAGLDVAVARRIVAKLEQAAENPLHFLARLAGSDEFKLRIGAYRLLALLSHGERTILVERVGHRSRVYRRG